MVTPFVICTGQKRLFVAHLKGCQKRFLRQFYVAHALHALFAFFLLFKQLALTCNIAAVAFGGHVFAEGRHCFAGNDFLTNGSLNGYLKKLARNTALELECEAAPVGLGPVAVYNDRKSVNRFAVKHDVEAHEV